MAQQGSYEAAVSAVVDGRDGRRFAVTVVAGVEGSVTFSLNPTVWVESSEPVAGEVVVLSEVIKTKSGWRARRACRQQP